ncbi:hypothetical protein [Nonomuraea insulae]|uniref:Uncharacterized protein n=1 Tax=Nonomuraea insulae TaxID=1616787 RepID=A0ABW1D3X9_9ACTN
MPATTSKHTRRDAMRWSDEDLRSAIALSISWSGVARSLGYHPTATASRKIMQARARALELDTSHFQAQPGRPRRPRPRLSPRPEVTVATVEQSALLSPAPPSVDHFTRTWNDEELTMAVAGATSWRGVSRTLGLASKGGRQLDVLKKRVEALRLDTDHFTGTRRWSPAQLRQSAERSTWAEATDSLGVSDTRQNRTTIKRQAALAGVTTDHLDTVTSEPAPQPVAGLRHLREAATSIAAAWFTLRGFTPSLPLEAKPYDLLVDMGNSIQRVQVKSCMAGEGMVTIAYRLSGTSKGSAKSLLS